MMDLQPSEVLYRVPAYDEPLSLPLQVETRHAHMLNQQCLDPESRLRVFYQVMKDHLRRVKHELLQEKRRNRDTAMSFQSQQDAVGKPVAVEA